MIRFSARAFAALVCSVLLMSGCGQKGDLYQPKSSLADSQTTFPVE